MWGAGAGWISRLLSGGRIRVTEIHQERNPYFGGVNPEPIRPNVDEALGILSRGGYDLGLMLDGDADRAGAADEKGTFIHQLEVTGLLMYYLAEHRGLRDPVVISVNNTSMAGRLGEHYGIQTYETSVGFKYIGPKMIETGAMMGAEESGGFGFGMHLPERDGVYADLLLLDLFLREKAAGRWPVSKALAAFHELAGPSYYRRVDVHVDEGRLPRSQGPPARRAPDERADPAGRRAGVPDRATRHERRVQVLRRRRLLAARSVQRHRAARPGLHRGDLARRPRGDDRGRRAAGPRGMTGQPPGERRPGRAGSARRRGPTGRRSTRRTWPGRSPRWAPGCAPRRTGSGRSTCRPPAGRGANVAVLGMGGSAMGADVIRAAFLDRSRSRSSSPRAGAAGVGRRLDPGHRLVALGRHGRDARPRPGPRSSGVPRSWRSPPVARWPSSAMRRACASRCRRAASRGQP